MDGTYKVNLQTKMGNIDAKVKLITNGNELSGYIEVMGNKSEFSGGRVEGNNCYLSGKIKSMLMKINYDLHGELKEDTLYIKAKTNMGDFNMEGKRISD